MYLIRSQLCLGDDENCHHDHFCDQWEDDFFVKAINYNPHHSTEDNNTHNRCHCQKKGRIACSESSGKQD